jgi:L-ribulose-5-phosphate 4-epimerase
MTPFTPTPDQLVPELTTAQQLVVLARSLWREGYRDHLAGHITYALGDGTLLCNPYLLTWEELRPEHIIRIDLDGNVVGGTWPAPLGIPLHLELHKARANVKVALHNHSAYGTVWADMQEIPPVYDQSSGLGGGELVLVDEYDGGVNSSEAAAKAVAAMDAGDLALLAGHGVFVLGNSIRAVHQRSVALETRCRNAWRVRAAGSDVKTAVPEWFQARSRQSSGDLFFGFWETVVREELRADPALLDDKGPDFAR